MLNDVKFACSMYLSAMISGPSIQDLSMHVISY